jgi:SulP family sulfate permease
MAVILFIKRVMENTNISVIQNELDVHHDGEQDEKLMVPKHTEVYEIEGPLFVGTVQKFEQSLSRANIDYKVIILRMRNTIYLDAGGLRALEQLKEACDKKDVTIVLSGIHTQPYMLLQKTGMAQVLGEENIFDHIDNALQRAENLVK